MTIPPTDRRALLQLGIASTAAALSPLSHGRAESALSPIDRPARPVGDAQTVHRKLAYSMDSALTFSWLRGVRYAAVDNVLRPLWTMHLGTVFRTHDLANGYAVTAATTTFYTDLDTGALLKTVKNPITGKTVDIRYFPPTPQTMTYGRSGPPTPDSGPLATLENHVETGPAWIDGETISVLGDHLAYSHEGGSARIRVNDLSTFIGLAKDVADPRIPNPPSTMIFNDVNTWPPWLQMGDAPGAYFSRAWGRKEFSYDAMPGVWRALMRAEYPAIAADPASALEIGAGSRAT
jgi:hypothetical protein